MREKELAVERRQITDCGSGPRSGMCMRHAGPISLELCTRGYNRALSRARDEDELEH